MSKISRDNKKAAAKAAATGKPLKGKAAKTAEAKKNKKTKDNLETESKETKPSIPNYGKCCTCKAYAKFPEGCGHMCKKTKKPTPRKASCESYSYNA